MAAGVAAAVAVLVAGAVAAAAGVVGDAVVGRGVVVATVVVVGAVVVAGADVTGAVAATGAAEDDGVGDASGGRAAATAAGGGALLTVGADADFGSVPVGFAGAVVRAARSDAGRLGTGAGLAGGEFAGTREGVELADARGGVELGGVEDGRLLAVLAEVGVAGDDFAGLAARSRVDVDRSGPEGVTAGGVTAFGGFTAFGGAAASGTGRGGGTTTSVAGRGGTTTSVTGPGLFASGFSSGAGDCGGPATAISERATIEASAWEDRGTTLMATMAASATTSTINTPTPIRNEFGIGGSGSEGGTRNPGSSSSISSRES